MHLDNNYYSGHCQSSNMSPTNCSMKCDKQSENIQNFPIAMAYVPWQKWKKVYNDDVGLERGTIFPELDLPFMGEEVI